MAAPGRTVAGALGGAVANPRAVAAAVAAGRIGIGAALVLAPDRVGELFAGRDGRRPATRVFAAGLGARDVVIGIGTAWALGQGFGAAPWLSAGVVADLTDCLAMLRARRSLPPLPAAAGIALAGGGALSGAWLARELD
jgi:hypothetical protein